MSFKTTIICECCDNNFEESDYPDELPEGWINIAELDNNDVVVHHFCSKECLIKYYYNDE